MKKVMEQYQFTFHSEIIGFTSPDINKVRREIDKRAEKEKTNAIKKDIELHMYENIEGIPHLVSTCYLYDGHGNLIHGSLNETKRYLTETWRYHKNKSHSKTRPYTSGGSLLDRMQ